MGKRSSTAMRVCTILIVITHLPQVLYRMGTEFGDGVTTTMDYICILSLAYILTVFISPFIFKKTNKQP